MDIKDYKPRRIRIYKLSTFDAFTDEAVQRYLSGADSQYHATCLPPHVLQQYGEIRNEPEDAAVPYGA